MQLKSFFLSVSAMAATVLQAQIPADTTGMNINAQTWTGSIIMGWNLGNSYECQGGKWNDAKDKWDNITISNRNQWDTAWGNPHTTRAMLEAVRNAGFDAVRIPVNWGAHVSDTQTMTIDKKWMNRIQEVVDWCLELDMKVILNTHHEYWLEYHPTFDRQEEINRRLRLLWTQIATHFRDYDSRLAFAGVNEVQVNWQPPTDENTQVSNSFNQTFVDAVRATGGKNAYRNLVVQTYSCNPDFGLQGFTAPNDPAEKRLSVEFHYYQPYTYCGDCVYNYWGKAYKDKEKVAPEDERHLLYLFGRCKQAWYDQGLGVIIGEYGVSCHYDNKDKNVQLDNQRHYVNTVAHQALRHGFASFVWDNNRFGNGKDNYGIFDRNNDMKASNALILMGIQQAALF